MHNIGDIPLQLTVMVVRDGISFQDRTILKFSASRAFDSRIRSDGIWPFRLQSVPVRDHLRSDVLTSIRPTLMSESSALDSEGVPTVIGGAHSSPPEVARKTPRPSRGLDVAKTWFSNHGVVGLYLFAPNNFRSLRTFTRALALAEYLDLQDRSPALTLGPSRRSTPGAIVQSLFTYRLAYGTGLFG